ncbi:unnamed protein product [Parnassius apollo]|uniref:(apollo) hypothetical protein n=1 Tax=Parnassius apollo TaxID=110799 RepID=A0A8S3XKI0_PARAO|nr:unnamed protein product [Parnassius apollo]
MHRLFDELEPSLTVTEQNLADRVRYILRSNIFDVAELEWLRREAVPSSDENATAEDAALQIVEQPANVDAAMNTPVVVESNDDGTVAQELELEHMRSTIGRGYCGNAGDPFGSQLGPLRDGRNSFWRRAGSLPYHRRQGFHGWTRY